MGGASARKASTVLTAADGRAQLVRWALLANLMNALATAAGEVYASMESAPATMNTWDPIVPSRPNAMSLAARHALRISLELAASSAKATVSPWAIMGRGGTTRCSSASVRWTSAQSTDRQGAI